MKEDTEQVRVYKSDYKVLKKKSKEGDTTIARIIHEWREAYERSIYPIELEK